MSKYEAGLKLLLHDIDHTQDTISENEGELQRVHALLRKSVIRRDMITERLARHRSRLTSLMESKYVLEAAAKKESGEKILRNTPFGPLYDVFKEET